MAQKVRVDLRPGRCTDVPFIKEEPSTLVRFCVVVLCWNLLELVRLACGGAAGGRASCGRRYAGRETEGLACWLPVPGRLVEGCQRSSFRGRAAKLAVCERDVGRLAGGWWRCGGAVAIGELQPCYGRTASGRLSLIWFCW